MAKLSDALKTPPAIGGTAPAAGAFTTLAASGAVSGAGITGLFASPPAIGGTAPAAGAFTTLVASGVATIDGFIRGVEQARLNTYNFAASSVSAAAKLPVLFAVAPAATNTFADLSVYGNVVTAVGAPAVAAPKGSGLALTADGASQYWTIPDRAEFSFSDGGGNDTAFSIVSLVQLQTAGPQIIACKYEETTGSVATEWRFFIAANKPILNLLKSDATASVDFTADVAISNGYRHIAVTKSAGTDDTGANLTMYVDGVPVAATAVESGVYTGMTPTAAAVRIGAQQGAAAPGAFYNGAIPLVAIYASQLSAAEVYADYLRARALYGI